MRFYGEGDKSIHLQDKAFSFSLPQQSAVEYFLTSSNNFISFLISTSLFLAISGSLKVLFSCLLFNIFALITGILTFLATFNTYGLNKLTDIKEDAINLPERSNTIKKIKPILKFSIAFSFILSMLLGLLINILTLPILLFPFLLGVIYSARLSKNLPRLKDISGVKNITIALSWAAGSTFLPVIYLHEKKTILIILIFYFFFLKSYINSILFDVRDVEGDKRSGVRTIPLLLGINKTKNLLIILNSTLIPWLIFSYFQGFFQKYFFVLVFSIVYGYWYILHFCNRGIKIGRSLDLLVDGEWIPIMIFALIFKAF